MSENTQASQNVLTQIEYFLNSIDEPSSDRTAVHDQEWSNLCHSYALISCFRQVLIKLLRTIQANSQTAQKQAKIDDVIQEIKGKGRFSFYRMLTGFVGCVSPRSFGGMAGKQLAYLHVVVCRLVQRTVFEIEGWKRLIPVREIFAELELDINQFELSYEEVEHKFASSVIKVQDQLKRTQKASSRPIRRTFEVSLTIMYPLYRV